MTNSFKDAIAAMVEDKAQERAMELLAEYLASNGIDSGMVNSAVEHIASGQRRDFKIGRSLGSLSPVAPFTSNMSVPPAVAPTVKRERKPGKRTTEYAPVVNRRGRILATDDQIASLSPNNRAVWDVISKSKTPLTHPIISERSGVALKSCESNLHQLATMGLIARLKIGA